ncbi:MAG: hypothetical protein WCH42_07100 [Actinomycetes bacterium]
METVTSVLLVAAALIMGLAMVVWGVRGAIRVWREDSRSRKGTK